MTEPTQSSYSLRQPEFWLNMLKEEYLHLQNSYEDYDKRALVIKNLGITVTTTALGVGFLQQQGWLWILAAVGSLLFWYLEASWRGLGRFLMVRIKNIEKTMDRVFQESLSSPTGQLSPEVLESLPAPLQIASTWSKVFKGKWEDGEQVVRRGSHTADFFFRVHTFLPHLPIFALAVFLGTFWAFGHTGALFGGKTPANGGPQEPPEWLTDWIRGLPGVPGEGTIDSGVTVIFALTAIVFLPAAAWVAIRIFDRCALSRGFKKRKNAKGEA